MNAAVLPRLLLACAILLGTVFAGAPAYATQTRNKSVTVKAPPVNAADDDVFVALRDAARANDAARVQVLAARLPANYDLAPVADYYRMRVQIFDGSGTPRLMTPDADIRAFLKRYEGEAVADRLRNDWLLALGKRHEVPAFDEQYPLFALKDDPQLACYALAFRAERLLNMSNASPLQAGTPDAPAPATSTAASTAAPSGEFTNGVRDWLAVESARLLDDPKALGEGCLSLAELMASAQLLERETVWKWLRAAYDQNITAPAKRLARILPGGPVEGEADFEAFDQVIDKGRAWLARHAAGAAWTGNQRELAVLALLRIAKTDPVAGVGELERIAARLTPAQRAYAWGQVGVASAKRVMPEATEYFRRADAAEVEAHAAVLSDEARQWQARSALRDGDWSAVRASVERMSVVTQHESTWVYWHARALMAGTAAEHEQGLRLMGSIAHESGFYGMLAAEEIGRSPATPRRAPAATAAELAPMLGNAGFARALRLYALNLRPEGNREWNWQLRGMNDRQLLAAAEFARQREAFDRTVNTAERTRTEHDDALRYVMPFRELFARKASEANLDAAWVYGLVRQESRFVLNARSGVGASGLMQIMPATARYVAKRIGMSQYRQGQVDDLETNLTLGTHYLRLVAEDFDGSAVLASAAYNAGPGRARQWRNAFAGPVEGAIFAETIPFNETRDYVKKVLANAMYYAALLEGGVPSLKSRLGQVVPGGTVSTELP